jgi:hypothetical protein
MNDFGENSSRFEDEISIDFDFYSCVAEKQRHLCRQADVSPKELGFCDTEIRQNLHELTAEFHRTFNKYAIETVSS